MKSEYVDHLGTDLTVVNSARVSFDKESDWEEVCMCGQTEPPNSFPCTHGGCQFHKTLSGKDHKLISYLANHGHWTPFSHPQITMRETVPIFVARQRFKHMVGFTYNEVSRRYVDDTPEFFVPDAFRWKPHGSVKQGSGDTHDKSDLFVAQLNVWHDDCLAYYNYLIEEGVSPEQARMVLPQSMYTSYYVTGSLAAWARAYKQRIDAHSQKEIQDLAVNWGEIIKPLFPVSWPAITGE